MNSPPRPEGARKWDSRNLGPALKPIPVPILIRCLVLNTVEDGRTIEQRGAKCPMIGESVAISLCIPPIVPSHLISLLEVDGVGEDVADDGNLAEPYDDAEPHVVNLHQPRRL